jgi:hypothetical protein
MIEKKENGYYLIYGHAKIYLGDDLKKTIDNIFELLIKLREIEKLLDELHFNNIDVIDIRLKIKFYIFVLLEIYKSL